MTNDRTGSRNVLTGAGAALGAAALIAFASCSVGPSGNHRAACAANLRNIFTAMEKFADESPTQRYPAMSSDPGNLMFRISDLYPEYLPDAGAFHCPADKGQATGDTSSYWYPGYALRNDAEVEEFAASYRERLAEGGAFDDYLHAASTSDQKSLSFCILRRGVERFFIDDMFTPWKKIQEDCAYTCTIVPLLIERPENHRPSGGNVLYLDGHIEFIEYPGKWPMTKKTIGILNELDNIN